MVSAFSGSGPGAIRFLGVRAAGNRKQQDAFFLHEVYIVVPIIIKLI